MILILRTHPACVRVLVLVLVRIIHGNASDRASVSDDYDYEQANESANAIDNVNINPKAFETPDKKREKYEIAHTSLTSQHGISSYSYRRANFFQQLYYLIKRNIVGAIRNPRGMNAVFFVSIF